MNIIKRDGGETVFDGSKIIAAINKASAEVSPTEIDGLQAAIASNIENFAMQADRTMNAEEIQALVETWNMKLEGYETAKKYISYRYKHTICRQWTEANKNVISLLDETNESIRENSNKNAVF